MAKVNGLVAPVLPGRPHSPAQTWTQRLPSPPRINVPPPNLDTNGIPDIGIPEGSVDFEANGFASAAFLKQVTHGNVVTHNNMIDWRYEQRYEAQKILPFLFLGPVTAARDIRFLQKEGITMIFAVRNTLSAHARLLGSKAAVNAGIELQNVDVAGNQELIAAFPNAFEIINGHLSEMYQRQTQRNPDFTEQIGRHSPGKVLVFCESGNERSAALVTAYIMAMYSMDLVKAIQLVQSQRFAVSIDDTTRNFLESYQYILQAKRDVIQQRYAAQALSASESTSHHHLHTPTARLSGKRTLEDTYDDRDVEMDGGMGNDDLERFEKRDGLAPFQD